MKTFVLLLATMLFALQGLATYVTDFTGAYRNGQVFFTWNNVSNTNTTYKLYRSSNPITKGSQLSACEYMGYTNQNSAVNTNLTAHDGTNSYWIIITGGNPLFSTQGLFVTTTVANGSYYYALTTFLNIEDTAIIAGTNSLVSPVAESKSTPQPVLQATRTEDGKTYEIYGDFISSRVKLNGPLRFKAGWLGYDFSIYRNNATTPQALHLQFHAGGADFLTNITKVKGNEINMGVEDLFPDDENSGWLGSNEAYDPFKKSANNTLPVTGTNYFYTVDRIIHELNWVFANLPADSNRVCVDGTSFGSYGAFFFTLLHPEKIAAVDITSGIFNFGFQNDYIAACTMNTGQKNRADGDKLFGTVSSNLPEASGAFTYDLLNGGKMIHDYNSRSYPVIFSQNGKNDTMLGWTEKTIWYDSVNNNRLGGMYFFDARDHAGDGKTWNTESQFDMYRYRKNLSFPAFSNCSIDNNPGNGNASSGDQVGCINGYLDWNSSITDESANWIVKIYMKDLKQINNGYAYAPATCVADITPRRLQQFNPPDGSQIQWNVTHLNQVVQSGSFTYPGGLFTIPSVLIYKDTCILQLNYTASECVSTITPSGNISGCSGTKVLLTANSGSGLSYQWYKNDVVISGATKKTYNSKGSESGSFNVMVTNSGGCSAYSSPAILTRIDKPAAKINPQGSLDICGAGSVVLKAKNGTGTAWQWKKNTVVINGATLQSFTTTKKGDYTVTVTSPEGCTKTSAKVTVTSTCRDANMISASSEKLNVNISPNPAKDLFQIEISSPGNEVEIAEIKLMNLLGQPIEAITVTITGENSIIPFNVYGIPAGVYLVHAMVNGELSVKRVMIAE
ncbi:MAG: T9SS type A sorting domain-containing protein [Chitinophagales bacterium]